jgi:hypothetical protein
MDESHDTPPVSESVHIETINVEDSYDGPRSDATRAQGTAARHRRTPLRSLSLLLRLLWFVLELLELLELLGWWWWERWS